MFLIALLCLLSTTCVDYSSATCSVKNEFVEIVIRNYSAVNSAIMLLHSVLPHQEFPYKPKKATTGGNCDYGELLLNVLSSIKNVEDLKLGSSIAIRNGLSDE